MNKVVLLGNLVKDLEQKNYNGTTKQGVYCNGTIALRESETETTFIDFRAFDNTCKILCGYTHKGSKVLLEGKLQVARWQDQQGQNHSKTYVLVDRVELVDKKENSQNQPQNKPVNQNYNQSNQSNNNQSNDNPPSETIDFPF